ncbi:MAG: methionine synthase [SAR202 cluster bacterium]|nr:methionine synthase [SAR202 cluster bacterium]
MTSSIEKNAPLLPTTVIGSYATPGWMWTALAEVDKGNYGQTDIKELFDDAVNLAIMDQERAGVDIISDGEMRRWYFVQSFYKRMTGIVPDPPLRKVGLYGYDSPTRYHTVEKVMVPEGLGIVEEFRYAKTRTARTLKATCPGPLTISMHIRPREAYKDRLALAWEFAPIINAELKALVKEGADFIQVDEPSFAIIPGEQDDWIEMLNACLKGVRAKLALHVCFGNLGSRPRGKRRYAWMFPSLLDVKCEQLVFEFANREMCESSLWKDLSIDRELGAGVVDIKSFHVESIEDVAERIRELLQYVPAEKLYINPDCGFFQLPRWLSYLKLEAMVAGTKLVRKELA